MTRDEAINLLDNMLGMVQDNHGSDYDKAIHMAIDALKQPERKTGEWEQIEVSYFADMDDETKTGMAIASMFCPRCKRYHNEVYLYGNPTFGVNFCPNCGADMREQS